MLVVVSSVLQSAMHHKGHVRDLHMEKDSGQLSSAVERVVRSVKPLLVLYFRFLTGHEESMAELTIFQRVSVPDQVCATIHTVQ